MMESNGIEPMTFWVQIRCSPNWATTPKKMVGPSRLELPTSRLSDVCSNQLSYRPNPSTQNTFIIISNNNYFLLKKNNKVILKKTKYIKPNIFK